MPEDKNKTTDKTKTSPAEAVAETSPDIQATQQTREDVEITLEEQKIIEEIKEKAAKGKFNISDIEKIDVRLHKLIALKLIDWWRGRHVAFHLSQFQGLDHKEIAIKLIDTGQGSEVTRNLSKFQGLNHKEIALMFIKAGKGVYVAWDLLKFEGLDQEIALKLIEAGQGEAVAKNLSQFQGLDQEIALKLIEAGKGEAVAQNLSQFHGLDHKEIALKLIERGNGKAVAENLLKFQGLDHKEIAMRLIEAGQGRAVAEYLSNFDNLDQIIKTLSENDPGIAIGYKKEIEKYAKPDEVLPQGLGKYIQNLNPDLSANEVKKQAEAVLMNCKGVEREFGSSLSSLRHLLKSNPELWNGLVYPTIMSQKLGSFLCLEDLFNINFHFDEAEMELDKKYNYTYTDNLLQTKTEDDDLEKKQKELEIKRKELNERLQNTNDEDEQLDLFRQIDEIDDALDKNLSKREEIQTKSDEINNKYDQELQSLPKFPDERIIKLLKFITTQLGIKAHDILKNFILEGLTNGKIANLAEESDLIRDFLEEGAIPLSEVYEAYKIAKKQNEPELYKEVVEVTKKIQDKVAKGECTDEDFSNRFFPGIVIYTFPPAVGVEREQYMNLIEQREGRQKDVPEVWNEMQGKTISVSQGGYKLKEGEEFSGKAWQALLDVVSESKGAEVRKISESDMATLGKKLLDAFSGNKLRENQKEFLKALYDVYRRTGKHLPDSLGGHKEIMEYKEYVGDHLNDLIGLCLQAFEKEDKEGWTEWLKKDTEGRTKGIKGIVKQIEGVMKNEKMDDGKKQEVLKNILKRFDFHVEGDVLNQLRAESEKGNLEGFLKEKMQAKGGAQKYNLLIKNALLGKEYEKMYEEVQKFEFVEGTEKQDYQLYISKKKEHGCAGLNMGVCVAPDEQLWSNPNFSNVIIMKDNIAYGGMHFLVMEEEGKKYLALPGINPNEALLGQVAADQLFDKMMDYAKECAEKLGCEKVLIPTNSTIHSNRSAIQDVINNKKYKTFTFKSNMPFSYSPFEYSFQECYEVE